jgi:hypothetical protein
MATSARHWKSARFSSADFLRSSAIRRGVGPHELKVVHGIDYSLFSSGKASRRKALQALRTVRRIPAKKVPSRDEFRVHDAYGQLFKSFLR